MDQTGDASSRVTWEDYERFALAYLRAAGYRGAELLPPGTRNIDIGGGGVVAQVRARATKPKESDIRIVESVAREEQAQAVFFSRSGYSRGAVEAAQALGVACFIFDGTTPQPANDAGRALVVDRLSVEQIAERLAGTDAGVRSVTVEGLLLAFERQWASVAGPRTGRAELGRSWRKSVRGFFDRGLAMDDLTELMELAMDRADDPWPYFCGSAHRRATRNEILALLREGDGGWFGRRWAVINISDEVGTAHAALALALAGKSAADVEKHLERVAQQLLRLDLSLTLTQLHQHWDELGEQADWFNTHANRVLWGVPAAVESLDGYAQGITAGFKSLLELDVSAPAALTFAALVSCAESLWNPNVSVADFDQSGINPDDDEIEEQDVEAQQVDWVGGLGAREALEGFPESLQAFGTPLSREGLIELAAHGLILIGRTSPHRAQVWVPQELLLGAPWARGTQRCIDWLNRVHFQGTYGVPDLPGTGGLASLPDLVPLRHVEDSMSLRLLRWFSSYSGPWTVSWTCACGSRNDEAACELTFAEPHDQAMLAARCDECGQRVGRPLNLPGWYPDFDPENHPRIPPAESPF